MFNPRLQMGVYKIFKKYPERKSFLEQCGIMKTDSVGGLRILSEKSLKKSLY